MTIPTILIVPGAVTLPPGRRNLNLGRVTVRSSTKRWP